jgi:hypothetical protein
MQDPSGKHEFVRQIWSAQMASSFNPPTAVIISPIQCS